MTKRTPEQLLGALDRMAEDLTVMGLRTKARMLRSIRTEMTNFVYSEKRIPRKSKLSAAARTLIENHGLERFFADLL